MDLLYARWQMGLSLAFHIIFAVIGMAMPVMMVAAEAAWLRTARPEYLDLAKRWARGTAILFAVGAVSGTVLSFELGLLWPAFMEVAGPVIGMPFSLEGFAFFLEAIFLGLYLYGWQKLSSAAHLFAGVLVSIGGALSGAFVVTANAWMNTPVGFRLDRRQPGGGGSVGGDAQSGGGRSGRAHAAGGVRGGGRRGGRDPRADAVARSRQRVSSTRLRHRAGGRVARGAPATTVRRLGGARGRRTQPAKLAALEGQFATEAGAPLRIGGIPDVSARETRYALEIPGGLSWAAYGDRSARVTGLDDVPRELWPPVAAVHVAFQVMVAIGMWLALLALWAGLLWWRGRLFASRLFLRAVAWSTVLGFVAIEAGWTVTELGRQPWIIQGVMKTAEAVTPMPGLVVPFVLFTLLYLGLAAVVVALIRRTVLETAPARGAR